MKRSKKLQIELMARGLECQAGQLLDRAKILQDAGHTDMARQVIIQVQELIKSIEKLRTVELPWKIKETLTIQLK